MPHRAINADLQHLFHLKFDKEMLEVGLFQLFYYLGRNLVVLSLAYHMYVNLSYELWQICLFFLCGQLFWVASVPFAGSLIQALGVKHAIALRPFCMFIYWGLLPFILVEDFSQMLVMAFVLFAVRGAGGVTSLMAYDVFLAHHLNKSNRGKTVALLQIAIALSTILAPIMGGIITDTVGFVYTTYVGLLFFLISGIVLLLTPDEKFDFPYTPQKFLRDLPKETPKALMQAEFGRVFFDGVMYILWPLFLVVVITNMTNIGLVAGISSGVGMVVAFWLGKRMDSGSSQPEKELRNGAYRSVLLNFVRGIWWEPLTIGLIDSLNKVNDQTIKVPYDMHFYKWLHQKNTLERAQIRMFLSQSVYLICFAICAFLLYFFTAPKLVFISIFVLAAISLWWTQKISEVGLTVLEVEVETDEVVNKSSN